MNNILVVTDSRADFDKIFHKFAMKDHYQVYQTQVLDYALMHRYPENIPVSPITVDAILVVVSGDDIPNPEPLPGVAYHYIIMDEDKLPPMFLPLYTHALMFSAQLDLYKIVKSSINN